MFTWLKKGLGGALLALVLVLPAVAASDPPGRVGRLAWTENQVFFRVDRSDAAAPASANWPVSQGALFNTDRDGLAEIWIGSTALRLAGVSELEVLALDDDKIDLRLNEGTLAITVLDAEQARDLRIGTPEGAVRFAAAGRYRIDILNGRSEVTTQAGQALIEDGARLISLRPGQRAILDGGGYLRAERAYRADRFDDWVARREALGSAGESRRYLSPEMPGIQDLDRHGDWQTDAEYGAVWLPRTVAADWAPYRFGRWAWIAPWGWTWVDAAPWGFAPFHYGRWVLLGERWAWVPGRHPGRPVYAPALVGWVGDPGWQLSFSFGLAPAVGWFPLAPREVYVPVYRHSPRHLQQINIVTGQHVTVIERALQAPPAYRYRERPQALTVVPSRQFAAGQPVGERHHGPLDHRDLPGLAGRPSLEWLRPGRDARRPGGDMALPTAPAVNPDNAAKPGAAFPQPAVPGRMRAEPPRESWPDTPRQDLRRDGRWPSRSDTDRPAPGRTPEMPANPAVQPPPGALTAAPAVNPENSPKPGVERVPVSAAPASRPPLSAPPVEALPRPAQLPERDERRAHREAWRETPPARPGSESRGELPLPRPPVTVSAPAGPLPPPAVNPENRPKPASERPFSPPPAAVLPAPPPVQPVRPPSAPVSPPVLRPEPAPAVGAADGGRRHERREERGDGRHNERGPR